MKIHSNWFCLEGCNSSIARSFNVSPCAWVRTQGSCILGKCFTMEPDLWISEGNPNKLYVKFPEFRNSPRAGTPMAHSCNPSYLGGWDQEDWDLRPAQANSSQDPIATITRAKMNWRCGSSSNAPALQARSTGFKPQSYHQKKKKVLWVPNRNPYTLHLLASPQFAISDVNFV
jgi:hypothetical protein